MKIKRGNDYLFCFQYVYSLFIGDIAYDCHLFNYRKLNHVIHERKKEEEKSM